MSAYLDNSATTRPSEAVIKEMVSTMQDGFYNPSALYGPAVSVKKKMETCRDLIVKQTHQKQIVFTSGGTEANNLAILGFPKGGKKKKLLYSAAEHPSVVAACLALKPQFEVQALPLDGQGLVDINKAAVLMDEQLALICVMEVSNEVGAIEPLQALLQLKAQRSPEAWFHVDGVQGFLRQQPLQHSGINSYALSAHKIHGPKGIGALAFTANDLQPVLLGGGQEAGLRSGTENTPGIVGLSTAITDFPKHHQMRSLKLLFWQLLQEGIPDVAINGPVPDSPFACDHILNVSLPKVKAQTMMHALEGVGVYVSYGAACSSRSKKDSATLLAMGLPASRRESALRISFSPHTTKEETAYAASACISCFKDLYKYTRN